MSPRQLQLIQSGDPDDADNQKLMMVPRAPCIPIAFVGMFFSIGALTILAGPFQLTFGLMVFGALFVAGDWFADTIDIRRPSKIHLTRIELRYESVDAQRCAFSVLLDRISGCVRVRPRLAGCSG